MKRLLIVIGSLMLLLLISFIGVTYSYEYKSSDNLSFELIGPSTLYIDVGSEYLEYGINVRDNNDDISSSVIIDDSGVDTSKIGEYQVKYTVKDDNTLEYVYRNVVVIDMSAPTIKLIGGEEVYILLNGNYTESGYTVSDNYDDESELIKKVVVSGSVNTSKEGTYTLKYSVIDSSGNKGTESRKVIVKKTVVTLDNTNTIIEANKYNVTNYSNTIVKNNFNDDGIYIEGYVKSNSNVYKIKLKNKDNLLEYVYSMDIAKDNYYSGNIDLTMVDNGVYDIYVVGKKEERLLNKLNVFSKLVRAKVDNKLITFTYDDDMVTIIVEDFQYKYDIFIDPGHGGNDRGASNGFVLEKDINLKISKYEKCRYESMGYRVHMVRSDDTYGEMLGNDYLDKLDRRALAIGYYASVSRIAYSNHHNSSLNLGTHGFEIIVPNQSNIVDLTVELSLYNKYKSFYGINDNYVRVYSRDYDTTIYNKIDGKIYNNKNYYSVIRIPYELFNVKNIIYEPIYLSNLSDFNWYYSSKNWIKVAEIKIEEYVKYLGGIYNSDNSSCL